MPRTFLPVFSCGHTEIEMLGLWKDCSLMPEDKIELEMKKKTIQSSFSIQLSC